MNLVPELRECQGDLCGNRGLSNAAFAHGENHPMARTSHLRDERVQGRRKRIKLLLSVRHRGMQVHPCRVIECPECWDADEAKRQKGNFDSRERDDSCGKFRESSLTAALQSNGNRVGCI